MWRQKYRLSKLLLLKPYIKLKSNIKIEPPEPSLPSLLPTLFKPLYALSGFHYI